MSQSKPTESEIDVYAGHYVLHGDQSAAFRVVFPNSKAKAETIHTAASLLHAIPKVHQRIEELKAKVREVAESEFKIDAAWVLKQAVKVHDRCMQAEPVMIGGEHTGDYKFEAAGANKALELIGKHIDVQAFSEKREIEIGGSITPWSNLKASVDE